jgi:hypothetical protein
VGAPYYWAGFIVIGDGGREAAIASSLSAPVASLTSTVQASRHHCFAIERTAAVSKASRVHVSGPNKLLPVTQRWCFSALPPLSGK